MMRGVAALSHLLTVATILVTLSIATQPFTLSQIQAIDGFSPPCTAAYNTPLTACSAVDFTNGHKCSTSCVSQLQAVQFEINKACAGTRAVPDDLIGRVFVSKGVEFLCGESATSGHSDEISETSLAPSPSLTMSPLSTSSTAERSTTTTKSTTTTSTSILSSSEPTPTADRPTIDSTGTYINPALGTQTGGAVTASTSVRGAAASASATATENRRGSGGGGTPFDISSDSYTPHASKSLVIICTFLMIAILRSI